MRFCWISSIALVVVLTACSSAVEVAQEPAVVPETSADVVHIVQHQGETLGFIALWYTGKSENWKAIADYNDGMNPHVLKINQQIMIPLPIAIRNIPFSKSEMPKSRILDSSGADRVVRKALPASPLKGAQGVETKAEEDLQGKTLVEDLGSDKELELNDLSREVGENKVEMNTREGTNSETKDTGPILQANPDAVSPSETPTIAVTSEKNAETLPSVEPGNSEDEQALPPAMDTGGNQAVNPAWELKRERLIRELLDKQ
ncbi:MAG: LysM peptidoglycan-binding domain-containing protein [bacterium]|nr:LysM peptidoglycan-binding domain-containing protein [bacterium]